MWQTRNLMNKNEGVTRVGSGDLLGRPREWNNWPTREMRLARLRANLRNIPWRIFHCLTLGIFRGVIEPPLKVRAPDGTLYPARKYDALRTLLEMCHPQNG